MWIKGSENLRAEQLLRLNVVLETDRRKRGSVNPAGSLLCALPLPRLLHVWNGLARLKQFFASALPSGD